MAKKKTTPGGQPQGSTVAIDWPSELDDTMVFGTVPQGTQVVFSGNTSDTRPWYPSVLLVASAQTGHSFLLAIPSGGTQPRLIGVTAGLPLSVGVLDVPNSINVAKSGTDLVFQFNLAASGLVARRIL